MKTKLELKKESTLKRLLSDETFLPNLSIKQQNRFLSKLEKLQTEEEIDLLIKKSEKIKYES